MCSLQAMQKGKEWDLEGRNERRDDCNLDASGSSSSSVPPSTRSSPQESLPIVDLAAVQKEPTRSELCAPPSFLFSVPDEFLSPGGLPQQSCLCESKPLKFGKRPHQPAAAVSFTRCGKFVFGNRETRQEMSFGDKGLPSLAERGTERWTNGT